MSSSSSGPRAAAAHGGLVPLAVGAGAGTIQHGCVDTDSDSDTHTEAVYARSDIVQHARDASASSGAPISSSPATASSAPRGPITTLSSASDGQARREPVGFSARFKSALQSDGRSQSSDSM
ncbi:MAG: hypothetical protein EOO41_01900, partial [Methanobacteriota archaeon]